MSIKGILGGAATAVGTYFGGPVGGAIAGQVAGGILGNDAAKSANKTQQAATNDALGLQKYIYEDTKATNAPLLANTLAAQNKLAALVTDGGLNTQFHFDANDLYADPGYQFRMDQGTKAIQNSAAARGGLNSGATLKALDRYGQDYGSQEYGTAYNRAQNTFQTNLGNTLNPLQSLAGQAQTAVNSQNNNALNYGNSASSLISNQGNATAASQIAGANAVSGGLAGATSAYSQNNLLQQLLGGGGAAWKTASTPNYFGTDTTGGYTGGMSLNG